MKYKLVIWAMIFVCAIWGLAAIYGFIQQLFQAELEAWDEEIRQKKNREYERYEQPIITKKEIGG